MSEMSTLELVRSDRVLLAVVIAALNEPRIDLVNMDTRWPVFKAGCLPVRVSWEMCSCHGGRLWLTQEETGIHIELSSDEYDAEKGIDGPETELAWRIDNELVPTLLGFERYVYVVESIGDYGNPDRRNTSYFDSIERASLFMFDGMGGVNVDSAFEPEYVRQYPNPDMRAVFSNRRDEDGAVLFDMARQERKDGEWVDRYENPCTLRYHVFRKR